MAYCDVVHRASSRLGFECGVRGFRRGQGSVNLVVGFISDVHPAGFVTFLGCLEKSPRGLENETC